MHLKKNLKIEKDPQTTRGYISQQQSEQSSHLPQTMQVGEPKWKRTNFIDAHWLLLMTG